MFKAVCIGVKRPTPKISQIDLERIAEYFNYDHMNSPDPWCLQQNMMFYIIYYFCRRGRENLYSMTKKTFRVVCKPDGRECVIQNTDKLDKNHSPDDDSMSNEGRMYATNGKFIQINHKVLWILYK